MKKDITKSIIYLRLIRPIIHITIILLSFFIVYKLRFYTDLIPFIQLDIPNINEKDTIIFSIISSFIFVFIWFLNQIYEPFKPIHWFYKKFLKTCLTWLIAISFLVFFGNGFIFKDWISRFIILWWVFLSWFIATMIDIILNFINSKLESKNPYKILTLYKNQKNYQKIEKLFENYKIYKINWKEIEDENSYKDILWEYDILLVLWNLDKNFLQDIVDKTRILGVKFYHLSDSFFLEDLIYRQERIWPLLAFEQKPSTLDGWYRVLKRIFDISFAIFFIILFSWLYLIVALFILIKDWRPIIYKSYRSWKWWKPIKIYKFRSMVKNADKLKTELLNENERKWPLFKIKDDPRIKKWWKILRKTSIDEIPQFFNILMWNMSVVGPRPHLPEEIRNYEKWQKRLLSIKPWITWYSQIFGRDSLDFDDEAKLDLYYIQNWSIFLDLFVIVSTIKVVFKWK